MESSIQATDDDDDSLRYVVPATPAFLYSKLRVIRFQWNLKNNSDYVEISDDSGGLISIPG